MDVPVVWSLHSSGEASPQLEHIPTINLEDRGPQLYSQMVGQTEGVGEG